jgi:hypothetical protein
LQWQRLHILDKDKTRVRHRRDRVFPANLQHALFAGILEIRCGDSSSKRRASQ